MAIDVAVSGGCQPRGRSIRRRVGTGGATIPAGIVAHVLLVDPPAGHMGGGVRRGERVELRGDRSHAGGVDAAARGLDLAIGACAGRGGPRGDIGEAGQAVGLGGGRRCLSRDLCEVVGEAHMTDAVVVGDQHAQGGQGGSQVRGGRVRPEGGGERLVLKVDDHNVLDGT